ncbi:hypothetical protein RclHR1_16980004 [Rhizophagus clarus]|uniref:RING-type domain-containing protein n=1 Tax=Rhizophagus clarus TaxID=94130 RepID=A0A2Z6QMY8_9GLOM|nr:hypothetical protein RclHR1_16980004 [Rhizophagus clarus]
MLRKINDLVRPPEMRNSSAIHKDGMDRTHVIALAKNILRFTSTLATHINIPDVNPCSLCGKEVYSLASNSSYKEFTLALCGHIFHQKCLEKYLVNREARCGPFRTCPNKDCNRNIETFLSLGLFKEKGSQDKPSTTDENTTSMPVNSENATPVNEDFNVSVMKELGLLGREEQSSSKTTDKASSSIQIIKETSDQATSPIEVVSITPGNSENVDDSILKDSSGQIQRPICEKCSEEISLEFSKDTVFLSCCAL